MKRKTRVNLSISIIILGLINFTCKKDSTSENYYIITGIVTDQVTGKPVSGANVYYGFRPFGEIDVKVGTLGDPVVSGSDGSYQISILKSICDQTISFGQPRYKGQLLYATCDGYVGSDIIPSDGGEIKMYHPAEVHLHAKNDTINNNIDISKMWIEGRNRNLWGYPGFIGSVTQGVFANYSKIFFGRDFDTIFVVKQLWGNLDYDVNGGNSVIEGPRNFRYKLTPIPDSITHLDILF